MHINNYYVYSFKGERLYIPLLKVILCFSLCFSSSKILIESIKHEGQGFLSTFYWQGNMDRKKIILLNGFPKMPKTMNAKTVPTSLFMFPAKSCWLLILFPMGEIKTSFLSSNIQVSHFTTEYNFKHAKSGSSQNCKYIKITDRIKRDIVSKQQGRFIHLFVPLLMQQTFTGSFIYWVQTFIRCSGLC